MQKKPPVGKGKTNCKWRLMSSVCINREERREGTMGEGRRWEGVPRSLEEERDPEIAGEVRPDSVSCCDKPFRPSSSMRFLFSTSLALRSFSYSISSNASSLYDRTLFIPIPPNIHRLANGKSRNQQNHTVVTPQHQFTNIHQVPASKYPHQWSGKWWGNALGTALGTRVAYLWNLGPPLHN